TPVVGMGWTMLEDFLEADFVDRLAKGSPAFKFKLLRGALAPSRSTSNLLAGRPPWYRYSKNSESADFRAARHRVRASSEWKTEPRSDLSIHLISEGLLMDREGCTKC